MVLGAGDRDMPENEPLSQGCGLGGAWELEEERGAPGQPGQREAGDSGRGARRGPLAGRPGWAASALCVLAERDPWAARYVTIPAISCPINEKGADINIHSA